MEVRYLFRRICFGLQIKKFFARLSGHLHQLLQAGEVDVVDALHRWRSNVLLDVSSVHERQVYLFCHIGGRQDHDVGMSEISTQTCVSRTKQKIDARIFQ